MISRKANGRLEYVIRDRDARLSILKRARKGKRLLKGYVLWVWPLSILWEVVLGAILILVFLTYPQRGEPGFVGHWLPALLLALPLVVPRVLLHGVRFVHGLHRMRRGMMIVDDVLGSPIVVTLWAVFLGTLWIAPFRDMLERFVWA